jgi:hypothetical protein
MFKAIIKSNTRLNGEWSSLFNTKEEAQNWLDTQRLKKDRGQNESTVEIVDLSDEYKLKKILKKRKMEYLSLEDQLDMIYHKGMENWRLHIKKVKDNNPK